MNDTFECGDNPALVTYLYGECEPSEHAVIEAHVAVCAACAAELAAMESTRVQLASWMPPSAFGFSARRVAARVLRPQAWWNRPLQPWLQVAAATVIFAAGLALGVIRGTQPASPSTAARAAGAATSVQASAASAADLTGP